MILLLIRDYAAAGTELLIEQLQEESWSPGAGPSRCTPRVLQPENVRLMVFFLLWGHRNVQPELPFLQLPTASGHKLLWSSVLTAARFFSLPFLPASGDADWPSWSRLLASCSLRAFSCGSAVSPNGLASKLESSVLKMVSSLIRKSLMSAESHVGARVCSSVM